MVTKKDCSKTGFNPNFIKDIIRSIKKNMTDLEENEKRFQVKQEYTIDLCINLCNKAATRFQSMHDEFQKANDPLAYLESKKKSCYATFEGFCKGAMTTALFADLIGNQLREAIRQSVKIKAAEELSSEIRSNIDAFSGNRSNLEEHVLESLAENEDFDDLMDYIDTPKSFIERFIADKIEKYCNEKEIHIEKSIFGKNITGFCGIVLVAVDSASSKSEAAQLDLSDWLDHFSEEMKKQNLVMNRRDLNCVEYQDIKDIKFLKNAIAEVVKNIEKTLPNESSGKIFQKIDLGNIQTKILNNLCGCWVQCPFCKTLCTNTMENHEGDHSVQFHRPKCLKGWSWLNTTNLDIGICTTSVGSDEIIVYSDGTRLPWKQYREYTDKTAKHWSITPDASEQSYWNWIVCRFQSEIEKRFAKTFAGRGEIPERWRKITKEEAVKSLSKSI